MSLDFYCYKALNFENTVVKDYAYIQKKEDLYPLLKEKKLQLIKAYKPFFINIPPAKGTILKTLQEWCYFLNHLLAHNISLLDALKMLAFQTKPLYFKRVLYRLIYDLESGLSLSESLSKHPLIFNSMVVQTIKTSEKTGDLFKAFQNLHTYFNWAISIRKKITESLRYPLFLMCFLITIASILQIYFVPELLSFLNQSHGESSSLNSWLWMIDPLIIRFIELGETTGELSKHLDLCSSQQQDRLQNQLDKFISYLQPSFIFITGLLLLWMITAFLTPIYNHFPGLTT